MINDTGVIIGIYSNSDGKRYKRRRVKEYIYRIKC